MTLVDVHAQLDQRGVTVNVAGVTRLRHPVLLVDLDGEAQQTIGSFTLGVTVAATQKGTHMSRLVQLVRDEPQVSPASLPHLLAAMLDRLDAEHGSFAVDATYFLPVKAPVSGEISLLECSARFAVEGNRRECKTSLGVSVPVTSLCPCSREISDYGAHNQRSMVSIDVTTEPDRPVAIRWLAKIAARSGAAPIYPVLKRTDERFVTMQAFDNPVFAEDIARDVAVRIRACELVKTATVTAENEESIHAHNAFATVHVD